MATTPKPNENREVAMSPLLIVLLELLSLCVCVSFSRTSAVWGAGNSGEGRRTGLKGRYSEFTRVGRQKRREATGQAGKQNDAVGSTRKFRSLRL